MSTKTQAWINEDNYLGVMGADDLEGMVAAIMASPETLDSFDPRTEEQVRAMLDGATIEPVKIPTAILHHETWDGGQVRRLPSIDARPGRGFVKVLGIHLD